MEYSNIEALMQQIRDWADEFDHEAIIEVLPELKTPEQYYEAVLGIAYAYLNQEMYEDAEVWLRKVEEQGRESGVWNYRLAVALMHRMELDEALEYAADAVKVEPDYPWGWLVYSKVLYGLERKDDALAAAEEGSRLVPGDDEFTALIRNISDDLSFAEVSGVEEQDEDGEAKKYNSFCGSVLLNTVEIDIDKIMSDLKEEWGIEPKEDPEDSSGEDRGEDNTTKVFYVGDALVAVSLMPAKVPENEAERYAETNYMWQDAVEVTKTHQAHILVAVLPHGLTPVEAGKLYVKVVSACLRQPNAIGVYTSGTVFQPEFYIEVAEMMKDDEEALPVLDWIYLGLYRNDSGNNVYTYGMTTFGKDEMEILGSRQELSELQGFMFEIASYVIDSDVTLQDGETIGVSEEQKLPIVRSKGVSVEGMSLKIIY